MSSSKPVGWEQLGDYKLLRKFAEGQSCVLRLAIHRGPEHANALRAVKMPRPEFAQDPSFTQLLVSEAQLLACIQHPNVVAAHGFGREPGGYVALDYVEGDDFRSLQATGRTLPDPRVVAAIVADVLQGLDAVHDAVGEVGDPLRAVHQAPHARHILVSTDGRARLADFTHARVQRAVSERRRPSRLESGYRAPEQVMTPDQVDARTDLFVLGIAFWEALSGQSLFAAESVQQASQNVLSGPIPPPSQISGHSHPALDRVCLRALERNPQARFASAKDMLAALLDAALDIGGIALPAQVGRWVSLQAAAQLQARRALIGAEAPDTGAVQVAAPSIPPPPPALDVRQNPDLSRPFDRSKTLMGAGLIQRPAPASPGLSPTVLAEPEPAFRPSRPPSSRPPAGEARGAAREQNKEAPAASNQPGVEARGSAREQNQSKVSSRPPPTGVTYGDRPSDTIGTEGVETERAVDGPGGAAPTSPGSRPPRGRITEEYVMTSQRQAPAPEAEPATRSATQAQAASVPVVTVASATPPAGGGIAGGAGAAAARSAAPPPAASVASPVPPRMGPAEQRPTSDSPGRSATPPLPPRSPPGSAGERSTPRSVSADFLRMTAFAVITVLLGDGLIRSWFGSPYGTPHVPPLPSARDVASDPR